MIRRPPKSPLFPTRRSSDLYDIGSTYAGETVAAHFRLRNVTATAATASDRKSTRLNSSHMSISYAVFCLKKKKKTRTNVIVKIRPTQASRSLNDILHLQLED